MTDNEPDALSSNEATAAGAAVAAPAETPENLPGDATEKVDEDGETFPREYVEKLRKENADARVKVKDRDDLAARLHTSLVTATGRLADPSDLPFDETHLDDPAALTAAIDDLLARKPHLATRRVVGDVGQGVTGTTNTVNLAGILRANAS